MKNLSFILIFFCVTNIYASKHKKVIFIVGPAGSGKTTAAAAIKNTHAHIAHYSIGNLLREEAKKGTPLAALIATHLAQATIVPLPVGMQVIRNALAQESCSAVLIDGFPPTLEYIQAFENFMAEDPTVTLAGTIEIMVSEACARERVVGRNRPG